MYKNLGYTIKSIARIGFWVLLAAVEIAGVIQIVRNFSYQYAFPSMLLSTLAVMAVVATSSLLLFFSGVLLSLLGEESLSARAAEALTKALGLPVLVLLLTAVFALLYTAAGRGSPLFGKRLTGHLPGALFSALGWILFSLLYSVYIAHFPRASAVYGALGAVCLVMLWLYVCTFILLLGAEINRYLAEKRSR